MDPLRLVTFTGGPPPAIEPDTRRFDTVPSTDAPMILTEPPPLLASIVNGMTEPMAMSMLEEPALTTQSRRGTPWR